MPNPYDAISQIMGCIPTLSMGIVTAVEHVTASPGSIVATFRNAKDFMFAAHSLPERFHDCQFLWPLLVHGADGYLDRLLDFSVDNAFVHSVPSDVDISLPMRVTSSPIHLCVFVSFMRLFFPIWSLSKQKWFGLAFVERRHGEGSDAETFNDCGDEKPRFPTYSLEIYIYHRSSKDPHRSPSLSFWEKYSITSHILQAHQSEFTPIPEFQLEPLPKTNPVLIGYRWKEYHELLGLKSMDFRWETVVKEKPDLTHLLDFPGIRIPDIDEDAFELEIGGLVNNPVKLTMKDLKDPSKFPQTEVTVTLQCTRTRRIEQINQYLGDGDELINAPWGESAIGTAVYRGVPLKKVSKKACGGVLPECQYLEFIGADTYFKYKNNVFNYAVSVPWKKVRQNGEVLLAWEMNGEPLPKSHGYPLRLVVTGYIGARSCKWVYRINALAEPSMGPVQSQEHLYFTAQNAKYSNGFSI
ncbi:molybdopterin binding oxidoreductase [Armillaria gallica]|uniref:Molybdopterin binding oxidoreductase n=1 Tax=Armillaria gallica TaxID=47427 RepID=A0A2H3DD37_ARMGA|nr:molybdopterin binding oxidoreductase [Armillaria gallica]